MINRKTFLKSLGLMAGFSWFSPTNSFSQINIKKSAVAIILPKRLKKGDVIGLVTPSGIITSEQLDEMVEKIEKLGYKTFYKPSVLSAYGYFAGTDQERADELMDMFANKNVDAILCARGGYGAIRMIDLLDYDLIKANPKIFIGYSDITAIITSIFQKTGLVCFHGPVGTSTFNDFSIKSFNEVLVDPNNHYKYPYEKEEKEEDNPEFDFYTINGGKAEGELIGGNISVLASMIGSKFDTNFENKIVYLEEVDEKIYSVDRMLVHLIHATNINKAAGIVLGVFKNCSVNDKPSFTLKEVIVDLLKPLNLPTVYGFPFGHIKNKMTIPTGIYAKFNADKKTLKLMEKAVS